MILSRCYYKSALGYETNLQENYIFTFALLTLSSNFLSEQYFHHFISIFLTIQPYFFYYILVCLRNYIFSKFLLLREKEKNNKITCSYFSQCLFWNFVVEGRYTHIATFAQTHQTTNIAQDLFQTCFMAAIRDWFD